jgi:hypothetical protein
MVGINCASEIALGGLRIADSAVRNRKVALPSRIGRIVLASAVMTASPA